MILTHRRAEHCAGMRPLSYIYPEATFRNHTRLCMGSNALKSTYFYFVLAPNPFHSLQTFIKPYVQLGTKCGPSSQLLLDTHVVTRCHCDHRDFGGRQSLSASTPMDWCFPLGRCRYGVCSIPCGRSDVELTARMSQHARHGKVDWSGDERYLCEPFCR